MTPCPYPIGTLLPHAPPMILLDEVLEYDASSLTAAVTITRASAFVEPAGVPAYVGLEYMAQGCGAYAGAQARDAGAPVRVGFLLGTRGYKSYVPWFRIGDRLTVSVAIVYRDAQMGAFECRIAANGALVAEAQLSVFQPEDGHPLLLKRDGRV